MKKAAKSNKAMKSAMAEAAGKCTARTHPLRSEQTGWNKPYRNKQSSWNKLVVGSSKASGELPEPPVKA
jgi:hypothetical protein